MTQKHLFIVVPNYDHSGTTKSPLSYLRLGSTTTNISELGTPPPGEDLLALAAKDLGGSGDNFFMDDGGSLNDMRPRGQEAGSYKRQDSGAGDKPSDLPTLVAELSTRGGRRDHTDGNRIVTTRGDRVDYVRGNYKRVTYGRIGAQGTQAQGDKVGISDFDISGGHYTESTSTPGDVLSIARIGKTTASKPPAWAVGESPASAWQINEEVAKGDTLSRFSGTKKEYYYGPTKYSQIGVSGEADKCPIISSDVYADSITDTVTATTIKETTKSKKKIESTTLAAFITDETGSSSTRIKKFQDHLVADSLTSQDFFLVKYERSTGGNYTTNHGALVALNVVGTSVSIGVGATANLAVNHHTIGLTLQGFSMDVHVAVNLNLAIGIVSKFDILENYFSGLKTDVAAVENSTAANNSRLSAAQSRTTAHSSRL